MTESSMSTIILSLLEKGGIAAGMLGIITICVIVLYRYVGTPMLAIVREITTSNQQAMADLRGATQNTKDTAASNVNLADKLTSSLAIAERFGKEHD